MNDKLQLLLLIGAVVTVLTGWFKWWRPKVRRFGHDTKAVKDSLLGRDALYDSITGKEIAPALPGVGQRMATIETALTQLVDMHVRLDSHEDRLQALEHKDLERAMARTESIEMLRTIDTAIRSTPNDGDRENR